MLLWPVCSLLLVQAALAAAHYPVPAPAAGVAAIDHAASQQPNQGAAFGVSRAFYGGSKNSLVVGGNE